MTNYRHFVPYRSGKQAEILSTPLPSSLKGRTTAFEKHDGNGMLGAKTPKLGQVLLKYMLAAVVRRLPCVCALSRRGHIKPACEVKITHVSESVD